MSAEFNTVMYRDVDSQLSVAYAALRTAVGFFLKLDRAKNQESGSDEKILERGDIPACGFDEAHIDCFLAKLIRAGKAVALAERVDGSGRWEVVRVIK